MLDQTTNCMAKSHIFGLLDEGLTFNKAKIYFIINLLTYFR